LPNYGLNWTIRRSDPIALAQEIIRAKRNGQALQPDQIKSFVSGLINDSWSEGQISALAMAVFFNGMSKTECVTLTEAMTRSGDVLDWSDLDLDKPVLDKHSTGGVGDNASLILAPLLAAAGAAIPMISGRGLGHTGGTLDKLDAIPGYNTLPDTNLFRDVVKEVGCAIIGQTGNLAPADKRLYAIRDVTATVESIPLITASVLSKKLAAGLDGLVMDVKVGNGAFADTPDFAESLARNLVAVAEGAGLKTTALITDMNEPLASAAGNAVEVRNAVDFLTGKHRDARLEELVEALAVEMMLSGQLASKSEDARQSVRHLLDSGAAAERFAKMVSALGGPSDFIENMDRYLPTAEIVRPIMATKPGWVSQIDTRQIGLAVVELGGGRHRAEDSIDASVGLTELVCVGDEVDADRHLALVHARTENDARRAEDHVRAAYSVHDSRSEKPSRMIWQKISASKQEEYV